MCAVSRYKCKSELYGADVIIDINSDIYPLELGQRYTLRITQTLVADVAAQKEEYDPVRQCSHVQVSPVLTLCNRLSALVGL